MMPTNRSIRIGLCAVLCVCGFLGNWFRINLFFNVDFLTGSIFSMLAIMVLGGAWGVITAIAAGISTYFIWNHPWAMFVFTGEAVFVSLLYARNKGNLVLYDLLYWVFIGIPLNYLFYHLIMGVSYQGTLVVMLKQSVNGVSNALIATISLSLYTFLKKPEGGRITYSELLFDAMAGFAILPIILLSVSSIRAHQKTSMATLRSQVTWVAENAKKNMNDWILTHHHNVQALASLIGNPDNRSFKDMQSHVELMKAATPEFKGMGVFNDRAVSVSYAPVFQDGRSNLGIDMSGRAHINIMRKEKKPYITDMLMSKMGDPSPIVVFLAPIVMGGEYKGYCSGVLEINQLTGMLKNIKMPGTQITLVDGQNRVIATTLPEFRTMDLFERFYRNTGGNVHSQTLLWKPEPRSNTSLMKRWADSVLFNESPINEDCRWRVIVEASLLPVAESTSRHCLVWLGLQSLLIFAAILASYLFSKGFISSVKKLQVLTRSVSEKMNDNLPIEWPDSTIVEIVELSTNFQEMTSALFKHIKEQNMAKKELHESLQEKTSLLNEVHHRVKNNLQIVTSLLWLQAGRTNNRQAVEILEETGNRVRSMALLHETLYRSGNLMRINLAVYLKDLCEQLFLSFGMPASRITMEYRITPMEFLMEPALPCGLIVNELVSNALKHGFPENRSGKIIIGLELTGDETIALYVQDNGTGLPPGFDNTSKDTLGMRLVNGLVKQLGGEFRTERPQEGGSLFCAVFPIPADTKVHVEPVTDSDGV